MAEVLPTPSAMAGSIPEPMQIPRNLVSPNFPENVSFGGIGPPLSTPSQVSISTEPNSSNTEPKTLHINAQLPLSTFVNAPTTEANNTTSINMFGASESSEQKSSIPTIIKKTGGLWSWFTNTLFLNKFAEKAKSSVDTMITTLDPGMREFIYSGGDVRIFVATPSPNNDATVVQIRDAFQTAFGRATVTGEIGKVTNIAPQSVGFSAALKAAEEKVSSVQFENNLIDTKFRHRAFVAAQDFVVELVPDRWYDITCLVLRDQRFEGDLQVFSQPSAIPPEYINRMQDLTPLDYPLRWSGFATTVGEVSVALSGNINSDWRESVCGVSTKERLNQAAKSLACMYRRALAEQQQWP